MTIKDTILAHLCKVGSISIREAMDDYSVSGGSLTKYITILKREGYVIKTEFRRHPVTGRRYARYHILGAKKTVPMSRNPKFAVGDVVELTKAYPGLSEGKGKVVRLIKDCGPDVDGEPCYLTDEHYYVREDGIIPYQSDMLLAS